MEVHDQIHRTPTVHIDGNQALDQVFDHGSILWEASTLSLRRAVLSAPCPPACLMLLEESAFRNCPDRMRTTAWFRSRAGLTAMRTPRVTGSIVLRLFVGRCCGAVGACRLTLWATFWSARHAVRSDP